MVGLPFLFAEFFVDRLATSGVCSDEFYTEASGRVRTRTNHAGGMLGGISNGEDVVVRLAVKPPSSISKSQHSVTKGGEAVELEVHGRHDPCLCPRAVPVAEAMVALVLVDHWLRSRAMHHL